MDHPRLFCRVFLRMGAFRPTPLRLLIEALLVGRLYPDTPKPPRLAYSDLLWRASQAAINYYGAIDHSDAADSEDERQDRLTLVLRFFSADILYWRGLVPPLRGIADMSHFYRHVRSIKGTHTQLSIMNRMLRPDGNALIATKGVFVGIDRRTGEELNIPFDDFLVFSPSLSQFIIRYSQVPSGI